MAGVVDPIGAASSSPAYENDVFVSYAHLDDQSLAPGQPGWITTLHRALEIRLGQLLGKSPRIWRDPKLQGNDVFAETLVDRLPRVAVLVSVLSPPYIRSEWCLRELNEFLQATGGARLADKLRVFKVVKTPISRAETPEPLQSTLGYEFFTVDPHSGREHELGLTVALTAPEDLLLSMARLDDLAHDVAALLKMLGGQATATADKGCVYVAETSSDQRERRDAVRRELQGNGYTVLPDRPLPVVGSECASFVREQLARCRLSVHLIGQHFGIVPEMATDSIVVLQHDLAAEQAGTKAGAEGFCRLIWMPPDLVSNDPRQEQFLARLRSDPMNDKASDLLTSTLEDFKQVLHARLNPPRPRDPAPVRAADSGGGPFARLYLICDPRDIDRTRPLEDVLLAEGLEVVLPIFDGDEAQVRQEHEANLAECDGALIYYGAGNELWLRSKLRELRKAAGYGRTAPLRATAIYVTDPPTPEKARLRTLEAMVFPDTGAPIVEELGPFLSKLR